MATVLHVRKDGSLLIPPEVLGRPDPDTEYTAETAGREVILHRHLPTDPAGAESWETWLRDWDGLAQDVGAAWRSDKSAAEVVSEMRR